MLSKGCRTPAYWHYSLSQNGHLPALDREISGGLLRFEAREGTIPHGRQQIRIQRRQGIHIKDPEEVQLGGGIVEQNWDHHCVTEGDTEIPQRILRSQLHKTILWQSLHIHLWWKGTQERSTADHQPCVWGQIWAKKHWQSVWAGEATLPWERRLLPHYPTIVHTTFLEKRLHREMARTRNRGKAKRHH